MVRLEFGLGLDCGLAMCTYERLSFVDWFLFYLDAYARSGQVR